MAQATEYWTTQRDGNWSRPFQYHDSPWWSSDEEIVGSGLEGTYPGDGWTVVVKHALTVDVDILAGLSLQSQVWTPLTVSTSAGSSVTGLPNGSYSASAAVHSIKGETGIGNTATAAFVLAVGTSKPRITFSSPPPAGCEYWLFLSHPTEPTRRNVYCTGITGTTIDLVSGLWENTWTAGVASGGSVGFGNARTQRSATITNALTIHAAGSLIVAAGKSFKARGDIEIQSVAGSTKPYITINSGSTFEFDESQAVVPTAKLYRLLMSGDGDIRIKG